MPARTFVCEIAVRRCDDADVDRHGLGPANAIDDTLLNGAQQLGLKTEVHFGNFIEQQGAAVGFLELADTTGHSAGESALFMAEKLGFEQIVGDRRAVDGDERLR